MNPNFSDEQLTAYALGETDDEMRAAIEAHLESNPEARRMVEEIRAIADLATSALEPCPEAALEPAQRAAVLETARRKNSARSSRMTGVWLGLAAAAGLAIAAAVWLYGGDYAMHMASVERDSSAQLSQEAEAARMQYLQLKQTQPSVERFFITDINNPAASLRLQFNDADFEDPAVQRQIQEVAQRVQSRENGRLYLDARAGQYAYDMSMPQIQSQLASEPFRAIPPDQRFIDDPNLNYWPGHNTEDYSAIVENPFLSVLENPLSTFSIDVDTASYANTRRYLTQLNQLPPKDSVRIEEFLNYFDYDYAPPTGDPFSAHVEISACPWAPEHRLSRIGIKGWEMANDERPVSNLVFLIDVSGSMTPQNKLPLLQQGLRLMVQEFSENDWVSIVVYAGASGLVLPPTPGDQKEVILQAIENLRAGGSTNAGQGIQLAYDTATEHFIQGGVNRVILATDGDFNVGITDQGALVRLIEEKAKSGVYLTILGFGMGNLKDGTLELLSNKGNGNYAYIDNLNEARKVLVEEMGGTLVTIAKDVKIQVEFNPAQVEAYRLIGYENRMLRKEDFNDDTVDAGDIGAGHTVTALYELVPAGVRIDLPSVDPLRYQPRPPSAAHSNETLTLKLRYKQPDGDVSKLLSFPVADENTGLEAASNDFRFATAVAGFGLLLRDSKYKGSLGYSAVLSMAEDTIGEDPYGYRREFLGLVRAAAMLADN